MVMRQAMLCEGFAIQPDAAAKEPEFTCALNLAFYESAIYLRFAHDAFM